MPPKKNPDSSSPGQRKTRQTGKKKMGEEASKTGEVRGPPQYPLKYLSMPAKEDIQGVSRELDKMGLGRLPSMLWQIKSISLMHELIEWRKSDGETLSVHPRCDPNTWTPELIAEIYQIPNEGSVWTQQRVTSSSLEFFPTTGFSGRDGWTPEDCTEENLKKVFKFLTPLFKKEKPRRVTLKLGCTIVRSWKGEEKINWAAIMAEHLHEMVEKCHVDKRLYLSPWLYHIYKHQRSLSLVELREYSSQLISSNLGLMVLEEDTHDEEDDVPAILTLERKDIKSVMSDSTKTEMTSWSSFASPFGVELKQLYTKFNSKLECMDELVETLGCQPKEILSRVREFEKKQAAWLKERHILEEKARKDKALLLTQAQDLKDLRKSKSDWEGEKSKHEKRIQELELERSQMSKTSGLSSTQVSNISNAIANLEIQMDEHIRWKPKALLYDQMMQDPTRALNLGRVSSTLTYVVEQINESIAEMKEVVKMLPTKEIVPMAVEKGESSKKRRVEDSTSERLTQGEEISTCILKRGHPFKELSLNALQEGLERLESVHSPHWTLGKYYDAAKISWFMIRGLKPMYARQVITEQDFSEVWEKSGTEMRDLLSVMLIVGDIQFEDSDRCLIQFGNLPMRVVSFCQRFLEGETYVASKYVEDLHTTNNRIVEDIPLTTSEGQLRNMWNSDVGRKQRLLKESQEFRSMLLKLTTKWEKEGYFKNIDEAHVESKGLTKEKMYRMLIGGLFVHKSMEEGVPPTMTRNLQVASFPFCDLDEEDESLVRQFEEMKKVGNMLLGAADLGEVTQQV